MCRDANSIQAIEDSDSMAKAAELVPDPNYPTCLSVSSSTQEGKVEKQSAKRQNDKDSSREEEDEVRLHTWE